MVADGAATRARRHGLLLWRVSASFGASVEVQVVAQERIGICTHPFDRRIRVDLEDDPALRLAARRKVIEGFQALPHAAYEILVMFLVFAVTKLPIERTDFVLADVFDLHIEGDVFLPGSRPLELKPVAIEDLLNRAQVPLDRDGMARLIQGRRVVVTGAGGTIGSELARQVAAFGPAALMLADNGEYALWQIDLELAESHPAVPRQAMLVDIRDEARVRAVFEVFRPELVFHAAALKHVPMVEANPLEGLMTNVVGTRHVADAARAVGTLAMVLISTDKAVNPTSVMGASKRLAEMYCQALDLAARGGGGRPAQSGAMRCVTVRFGNVLGSTGSVVPLFQRQLARGGPLTVTHPDMRRYFMTVREAVSLVLQASVLGVGDVTLPSGLDGGIFVLDMGEPVKIVDLARQMIRLAGLHPDVDVEIRFTGLRPGEKLFEELFHGKEPPVPTGYAGLLMAMPRTADPAIVGRAIDEIASACRNGQSRQALALLSRLIPEFEHNADGSVGEVRA
ncbi:polysaccharide biosynthesis protein [bacterium]|nr:polysaccharide biosynthesis protein [bacterium]